MPSIAAEADLARVVRSFIVRALDEYGVNPAVPSILRGIAVRAPDVFIHEAITQLQSGEESPGHRQLAILLLRHPKVMALLAHPRYLKLAEAVTVAKRLLSVDSLFDIHLARQLPGRDAPGVLLAEAAVERVLDVINEISRGGRIVPLLGHLTEHPNSRIAAKATLVLGRRIHNNLWIQRQLASKDFRIRANAVEALWGSNSECAVDAFNSNLSDSNNRVVGNAVIGLHLLKAADVSDCVNLMVRRGSPQFRWTAAWVMGKTARPEFVDRLQQMMRDDAPGVRGSALRALFNIRRTADPQVRSVEPIAQALPAPPEGSVEEVAYDLNLHLDGMTFAAR